MSSSYGAALPDQAKPLLDHIQSFLTFYSDVDKFVSERAQLEREYGTKLQALSRKMGERKIKRGDSIWVGEAVGKGGGVGGRSTFNETMLALLTASESTASSHINLADKLTSSVSDALKEKEIRKEKIRTRYYSYYEDLISQRDAYFQDRAKYQDCCTDLETARLKHEKAVASGDRHSDRAEKAFKDARSAVGEAKNALIVLTHVANRLKEKFYRNDLPDFEDKLQDLHLSSLSTLHTLLSVSQTLTSTHLSTLTSVNNASLESLKTVDLEKDLDLYIEFNTRVGLWKEPEGFVWEPAVGFYEEGEISLEEGPKTVMQNKLARTNVKVAQLAPVLDIKSAELKQLEVLVSKYAQDPLLGDPDKIMESLLGPLTEVATMSNQVTAGTVVIETLVEALGDDQGSLQPHDFKSSAFTIPTQCHFCKSSIWGLSKQGKTCRGCAITVHAKCELKVPSNCRSATATSSHRLSSSNLSRSGSTASSSNPRTPVSATSRIPPSPFPTEDDEDDAVGGGRSATVMFDFTASSEFEISLTTGETVTILEEDDGSGWLKVLDSHGGRGLCPVTYVEIDEPSPSSSSRRGSAASIPTRAPMMAPISTPAPPASQGNGKFVKALYDYAAQGSDELSLTEGELVELTPVGQSYGEGWWEGVREGKTGIFPSNYCEDNA
ncbi:hypothetical protein BDY24DRAFT_146356 [Mrakia frigida]|uniref:Bzz1p n=1 Tax=Mrakia frigida TaxID=29902 RepID=UPI003FCC1DA4